MYQHSYPNTAYILSLIGALLIILGGIIVGIVGAAFTFFMGGIGGIAGLFGVIWGIVILISAFNLKNNPSQHVTWGIIILIFSLVSWFGSIGGFGLGFLLSLIGGIMALVWTPPASEAQAYAPPPTAPAAPSGQVRYCTNCGRSIPVDVKFCPYCGTEVK